MTSGPPRRWLRPLAAIGGLLLFTAFIALGTWQIQRRAWKLALIERVTQRVDAAPTPAPGPTHWHDVTRANAEYRRVEISGRWQPEHETFVQASTILGPGHWVLTPLTTADGWTVLVNRGFVDVAHRTPTSHTQSFATAETPTIAEPPSANTVRVVGLLRLTEPDGGFLRNNDPTADRWFSRDVQAIAQARGIAPVAPYFIDMSLDPPLTASAITQSSATPADPNASSQRWPVAGLTVIRFRNDHLVYALTWYALALMVAGAAVFVFRQRSRRHAADDAECP